MHLKWNKMSIFARKLVTFFQSHCGIVNIPIMFVFFLYSICVLTFRIHPKDIINGKRKIWIKVTAPKHNLTPSRLIIECNFKVNSLKVQTKGELVKISILLFTPWNFTSKIIEVSPYLLFFKHPVNHEKCFALKKI